MHDIHNQQFKFVQYILVHGSYDNITIHLNVQISYYTCGQERPLLNELTLKGYITFQIQLKRVETLGFSNILVEFDYK